MSKVYEKKPNVVEVTLKDKSGQAERFLVGKTLDEAIETLTEAFDGVKASTEKPRRRRRTKAEMAAAQVINEAQQKTDNEPEKSKKGKTWA